MWLGKWIANSTTLVVSFDEIGERVIVTGSNKFMDDWLLDMAALDFVFSTRLCSYHRYRNWLLDSSFCLQNAGCDKPLALYRSIISLQCCFWFDINNSTWLRSLYVELVYVEIVGVFSRTHTLNETKKLVVQETTSWYDKKGELTLADIIMVIRKSIWVKMYFSMSKNHDNNTDSLKITEKNANLLIYQLALAA